MGSEERPYDAEVLVLPGLANAQLENGNSVETYCGILPHIPERHPARRKTKSPFDQVGLWGSSWLFQKGFTPIAVFLKLRPGQSPSDYSEPISKIMSHVSGPTSRTDTSGTYRTALSNCSASTGATYITAPLPKGNYSTIPLNGRFDSESLESVSGYLKQLDRLDLIPRPAEELDWSGQGEHVEFPAEATVPLKHVKNLGFSSSAIVDKVQCRRIFLARKTMRRPRDWTHADALNEIKHLHHLRHAHIVQLVGTYVQSRNFAILMYPAADSDLQTFLEDTGDLRTSTPATDTCAGQTIGNVNDDGCLPQEYWLRLRALPSFLGCLISALAYMHSQTTKHMDIKPGNVLVKYYPDNEALYGRWKVYLADFGFSRQLISNDSQTDGPTAKTPRYCAPEVYCDEARGRAADIFSMGCVFAEILTVYFGKDVNSLQLFLRGRNETDHYHANIQHLQLWVRDCAFSNFRPASSRKGHGLIAHHVNRMLERNPGRRPNAAFLRDYFRWDDGTSGLPSALRANGKGCCDSGPETYIAEGA